MNGRGSSIQARSALTICPLRQGIWNGRFCN